ncbi:MAG: zf-HC2 domain-containing protein, partial [Mycobacterium sp.]
MECEIAREALSARMDGEREPVPTGRVDEHLASCQDCRRWQAQMESQMQLLRGLATTDRTRMTAVSDTVHAPIQRRRPWARVARVGLALATASVLALGLGVAESGRAPCRIPPSCGCGRWWPGRAAAASGTPSEPASAGNP